MRVVIAGQKRFGRDVLQLCINRGYEIAAVSCPVHAPGSDLDKLHIAALNKDLLVIASNDFNARTMPDGVDLIVAAHCHSYISKKTRNKAKLGALGYHPSILPLHRGRSAIEWAIRMRERITGGTVYWFNDVVDGGPIAAQDFCLIWPGDDALSLWSRELAPMGLRLFTRVFGELSIGKIVAVPQDKDLATWEPAVDGVPPLWRPDCLALGTIDGFQIQNFRYETEINSCAT